MTIKAQYSKKSPSPKKDEFHPRDRFSTLSAKELHSPFSSSTIHRVPAGAARNSDRRIFDNNLVWCAKIPQVHPGVTDLQFFRKYAHTGIVDAYILHSPKSFEPISSHVPLPTQHNAGLLVFPGITALNHFMENLSADLFPDEKIEVVYLPSLERLRTPVGCNHIGCRTLLCILLHSSFHTPAETSEVIKGIEDRSHAAQILCHSRFASPGLATVIHRCKNIQSFIAKEILTTLISEASAESYIADSMMLFGELHRKMYFSVDPVSTLESIFTADITFTGKILRGLLVFVKKLRDNFARANTDNIVEMWRLRSYTNDAKEPIVELLKLLEVGNEGTIHEMERSKIDSAQPVLHTHSPLGPSQTDLGSEMRPMTDTEVSQKSGSPGLVINLPISSKHTCVACNGRAKLRCSLCDKHFCSECQKHDAQLHESLVRTVYVSKVDPTLSVKELRLIFDKFGLVSKVRLCGDPQQRGMYAFIEFTSSDAAQKMLQMDKQPFREGKDDTWRCLPARQPIHDHNDDDMIASGSSAHPCFFGIPKNMQAQETSAMRAKGGAKAL